MVGQLGIAVAAVAAGLLTLTATERDREHPVEGYGAPGVTQQGGIDIEPPIRAMRVDELIGHQVENQFGDPLGEVTAVVLDRKNGRPYAVLAIIGAFDVIEAEAAVPLDDLTLFRGTVTADTGVDWPEVASHYPYEPGRFTAVHNHHLLGELGD